MSWKKIKPDELAESLGVNSSEVREKQKLIKLIIEARKKNKLSQVELAKKVGVTQSRIAQIESGIGTSRVSFDVLLNILTELGYDYRIVSKRSVA
ncbi:MAG: helix-turn-helix domain-containing protein [Proteobacteria bacterium]|nr:helix-turn-helix domain-containing protein [Pseudomonadota bacterium]